MFGTSRKCSLKLSGFLNYLIGKRFLNVIFLRLEKIFAGLVRFRRQTEYCFFSFGNRLLQVIKQKQLSILIDVIRIRVTKVISFCQFYKLQVQNKWF
jgi:hypothetical protein